MSDLKQVYLFEEGNAGMKKLLGGKGANLAEMSSLGLPVPPGFVVSTEACRNYYEDGEILSQEIQEQILEALSKLEKQTEKELGSLENPLLLSVRSGSYYSMPGMMDTILNLGLNDATVETLASITTNRAFALDCYRRFIQMFGEVVLKIYNLHFERVLEEARKEEGVSSNIQLSEEKFEEIIKAFKNIITTESGEIFPQDPKEQLFKAIRAVFASWNNQRAIVYRRLNNIPAELGTAVTIQSMVFGNLGEDSGTGVAFSRNPSTGEKKLYGEFLFNSQGEDVVAGTRTPLPISALEDALPEIYKEFSRISMLLENHYRDMQDIEFTIERGNLFILQTRTGKRTARAAVRVAVDLVEEGICTREEALLRVDPSHLVQLLHPRLDPSAATDFLAQGLPASPGAAVGKVVFDADIAEEKSEKGENVILVRPETTPDDIHGIVASQGVITSRGGMTSHAAVVARGMGKSCISGCEDLKINLEEGFFLVGERVVREGEIISMDGTTGKVYLGGISLIPPQLSDDFNLLLSWADEARALGVYSNADTPMDARKAREFGAEGIGLCRTEHMFMEQDRLPVVQEMILAENDNDRQAAIEKLLPMQQGDFEEILREMAGLPVTIRLLDPPLHEFLPDLEELLVEVALLRERGVEKEILKEKEILLSKVRSLEEFNPMLGHRGCRLGLSFPEVYRMQVRAICLAEAKLQEEGVEVQPEIMIPLVGHFRELELMRKIVVDEIAKTAEETGKSFKSSVGTMIELPRACVTAGEIAHFADFFSFGTNDLTQMTFGFSRDDAEGKFLPFYMKEKILNESPFTVLDREGVGSLVSQAVTMGREKKPGLKMGICGEHGGEPSSIEFCHQVGLNYVSCSPFRVPIARLAAAQAAVKPKQEGAEVRDATA